MEPVVDGWSNGEVAVPKEPAHLPEALAERRREQESEQQLNSGDRDTDLVEDLRPFEVELAARVRTGPREVSRLTHRPETVPTR